MQFNAEIVLVAVFIIAAIASLVLTGLLRRYALNKRLLDFPNERSSHTIATPRGGGLAIVLIFLMGLLALSALYSLSIIWIAFLGASIVVTIIGFIDDHGHIAPQWRLFAHFGASIWALVWLGGFPPILLFGDAYNLGLVGNVLAVIGLVWLLNLYNFMDGIDGIAASEAIFVAGTGFLFAAISNHIELQLVAVLLIGSTLGFLVWNWPPAKIFLGDVGSGFLGLVLGIYALWAIVEGVATIWTWLIVLGFFILDATVTLFRRLLQGSTWYVAHRSHAYQHAARRWGHLRVTLAVSFINVFWLLPIAYFSYMHRELGLELTVLAYSPILVLVFLLGAGKEAEKGVLQ